MRRTVIGTMMFVGAAVVASGQQINVQIDNLLPSDGNALTPVFVGLGDGSFDLFNPGEFASAGLEEVAELGSTGTLAGEFAAADPTGLSATTTGGPILGGGSASVSFNVSDPTQNRILSFASMIVPTNDLFIGNGNGIEVFDAAGNFNGPITITIFGSNVWDAGTEVNNADNGAAFLQGIDATLGEAQGEGIDLFFNDLDAAAYLASLEGRTTAPGFVLNSTFDELTPIAQITITPAPATAGLAAFGLLAVRRRRF